MSSVRLEMDNRWRPDPPGTINPAKLSREADATPDTVVETVDTSHPPIPSDRQIAPGGARQSIAPTPLTPTIPRAAVPRLPRISSDWDPEHDNVVCGFSRHRDIRTEFEGSHVLQRHSAAAKARYTSHHGHFRLQARNGVRIHVPVDIGGTPDATVVIDNATTSIYDAYLLRADIMKNVNAFRRHQVCQHTCTHIYKAKFTNKMLFNR
jgi:poly [ADP-ribose] polymerase 2/3/4